MNEAQRSNHHHHHHHIAMLPPPGLLGHLLPFIELAKRLISLHSCRATIIIIPHDDSTQLKLQKTLLENLPPAINHIFLPPVRTCDLPRDLNPQILYPTCVIRSFQHLRDALTSFNQRVSALVMDLFTPFAVDVARELGIQSYIFYTSPASELALCISLPNLDRSLESEFEFRDLSEPLKLPGSDTTIAAEDLPDAFHDRSSGVYKMLVEMARKYQSADGIIVNTFLELEKHAFNFMEKHRHEWPPVYAVGPLIRSDSDRRERHVDGSDRCMKWLSDQPRRSVLYVSFGSGASLSSEQFDKLALGLEMSRHRFLWVVRSPQDDTVASYLNNHRARDDPLKFLPLGFLERVGERGLLVIDWAPQIEILSHESIGGYMTHCGWNSILESVVFGVPLIARPLVFEQNTNAVLVTDCLEVGIRVKENKKGIVGRDDIAESVRELMGVGDELTGMKIRRKMSGFKNAASRALEPDGSSTKALAEVFRRMTSGKESLVRFPWLKSSM